MPLPARDSLSQSLPSYPTYDILSSGEMEGPELGTGLNQLTGLPLRSLFVRTNCPSLVR